MGQRRAAGKQSNRSGASKTTLSALKKQQQQRQQDQGKEHQNAQCESEGKSSSGSSSQRQKNKEGSAAGGVGATPVSLPDYTHDGSVANHTEEHNKRMRVLRSKKEVVEKRCKKIRPPPGVMNLYGSFLPSKGLLISKVIEGDTPIFTWFGASGGGERLDKHSQNVPEDYMHVVPVREYPPLNESLTDLAGPCTFQKLPEGASVVIVSGSEKCGNKFSGTLPVEDSSCMVFDSTCTGVTISDSTAPGGLLVCRGQGCLVTFSNTHFTNCPVIVLDGAKVLFENCTLTATELDESAVQPSMLLYAGGRGTCITMLSCMMYCSLQLQHCAVVQDGASAVFESCMGAMAAHSQLEVRGVNSTVNCENCLLNCAPYGDKGVTYGVVANEGAFLRLSRTSLEQAVVGLIAKNGASAVVHQTTFSQPRLAGVISIALSNVKLTECVLYDCWNRKTRTSNTAEQPDGPNALVGHINGHSFGDAVAALHGGEVTVVRCVMHQNDHYAVVAANGSLVRVADSRSTLNLKGGVAALGGSLMLVKNIAISGSSQAITCDKCGPSAIDNVSSELCIMGFVTSEPKGDVVFTKCSTKKYVTSGFLVHGQGQQVRMRGCHVGPAETSAGIAEGSKSPSGVCVKAQGQLLVNDSKIKCEVPIDSGTYVTAADATGSGTCLKMVRCKMSASVGVNSERGSRVELSHCETSRCWISGVNIQAAGVGVLSHCSSDSDRIGVYCCNASVDIDHMDAAHYFSGVFIAGDAHLKASVRNSKFASSHPLSSGVDAQGEITLDLSNCQFVGSEGVKSRAYWAAQKASEVRKRCSSWEDNMSSGVGVHVHSSTSQACIRRCKFTEHAMFAVLSSGFNVLVEGCHTSLTGKAGYHLAYSGNLRVIRCSSDRDKYGISALGEGWRDPPPAHTHEMPSLTVQELLVRRAKLHGIMTTSGVKNCIRNSHFDGSVENGISIFEAARYVTHPGFKAIIKDCTVNRNGMSGVCVSDHVPARCVNVLACGNGDSGFKAAGHNSRLALKCCEGTGNRVPIESVVDAKLTVDQETRNGLC